MDDNQNIQNNGTGDDSNTSTSVENSNNDSSSGSQPSKSFATSVKIPSHPNTEFDENLFLGLLARSISLTKDEKHQLITTIPKLNQNQINELINILTEEKEKFAELNKKYDNKLDVLADKHLEEWGKLEKEDVVKERKEEDDQKAEEIRKSLGL